MFWSSIDNVRHGSVAFTCLSDGMGNGCYRRSAIAPRGSPSRSSSSPSSNANKRGASTNRTTAAATGVTKAKRTKRSPIAKSNDRKLGSAQRKGSTAPSKNSVVEKKLGSKKVTKGAIANKKIVRQKKRPLFTSLFDYEVDEDGGSSSDGEAAPPPAKSRRTTAGKNVAINAQNGDNEESGGGEDSQYFSSEEPAGGDDDDDFGDDDDDAGDVMSNCNLIDNEDSFSEGQ